LLMLEHVGGDDRECGELCCVAARERALGLWPTARRSWRTWSMNERAENAHREPTRDG
jgi:hypothetical protein